MIAPCTEIDALFGSPRRFGALLLCVALMLAGCDGDDGAPGPAGPPGPGSGVPVSSAERINVEVMDVSIAAGSAPQVNLKLTNDLGQGLRGLPAGNIRLLIAQLMPGANGASSSWQAYITRTDGGVPDAQATAEPATAGTFVDNDDGTYTYTFANALEDYPAGPDFDATRTHRLGIEIRTNSNGFLPENLPANNAPFDFLPGGGAPIFARQIVDNDTCNACHDNLELHGEARFDVDYCVQCHNPSSIDGNTGNSVDMTIMTHKIHYGVNLANGYQIIGFRDILHDYSNIVFAQDVRNCSTCHEENDSNTPQAGNWREVASRDSCGSCHDDVDWLSPTNGHPGGLVFPDDTQCLDCHGPDATVNNGAVRTAVAHEITSQLASESFAFNVLSVTDTGSGEFPSVTFSVTDPGNNDAAYDLAADPEFTACADGTSRLAVLIAWPSAEYTNRDSGAPAGQPVSINPLTGPGCGGTAMDNNDGSYTVTSPVAVPATVTGSLLAGLEGHPWVDLNADGLSGVAERIGVTNGFLYTGIAGAPSAARRDIVAIDKCNDCHNRLSVHGSNRTDRPEVCAACHNPDSTDINRRAGNCLATFGADDTSVDFKYMIHALHATSFSGQNYDVCGFGNRPVSFDFNYPGRLNNCEGCHLADTYFPVDGARVNGTTVDSGPDPIAPTDDVVVSPNTAACSGCHTGTLAREHMQQNGGDFEATKAADSTLISAGVETCALCHGPDRISDVKAIHGVDSFQFN